MPSMGNFSFASFFPSLDAKAALANSELFQRSISSSLATQSPLLPSVPEYENTGLDLEEMRLDEDSLEDWHLSALPLMVDDSGKLQPLAVREEGLEQSLAEVNVQNLAYSNIIESLMEEDNADAEDEDETPWIEHTVANGERMVDISHKYGILVATITKANNITDPNRLSAGQSF